MPRLVEFIFPQAIFSIDKPAQTCYNRADSADNGLAPILADFYAFVKRKILRIRMRARLGPV